MTRPPSAPPALPERVLAAVLGAGPWTDSILGDLHEEYARLASVPRRLAKPRADAWYCGQALTLGARTTGARAARGLSERRHALPATQPVRGDSRTRTLALETRYAARTLRFTADVVDALSRLPGVEAAAGINVLPSSDNNSWAAIEIDGRANPDPANPPAVDYRAATPAFFEAMRIPIVRGRAFTAADSEGTQPVAIVTQAMAAKYFPASDPVGRRIRLGSGPWATVVGISGDVIHDWYGRRRYPTVYRPYAQSPEGNVAFAVRATGDPAALSLAAARAVRTVDPGQPVFDVQTMRERLRVKTIGLQYVAVVMAAFGGLALVLAIVGVYSLMAFVVAQRTHEIGVRIALGATRADVMRLAVGQTARLTAVGAALGLVLATALGRLMEAGLLGVVSSDTRLSVGVAGVLVAAALAAGYIPARRATAIDPIVALRAE